MKTKMPIGLSIPQDSLSSLWLIPKLYKSFYLASIASMEELDGGSTSFATVAKSTSIIRKKGAKKPSSTWACLTWPSIWSGSRQTLTNVQNPSSLASTFRISTAEETCAM